MSNEIAAVQRADDIGSFYSFLDELAGKYGGPRLLSECTGRMGWPERGVYFFQEGTEVRADSGAGPRVVRVGTHALSAKKDRGVRVVEIHGDFERLAFQRF